MSAKRWEAARAPAPISVLTYASASTSAFPYPLLPLSYVPLLPAGLPALVCLRQRACAAEIFGHSRLISYMFYFNKFHRSFVLKIHWLGLGRLVKMQGSLILPGRLAATCPGEANKALLQNATSFLVWSVCNQCEVTWNHQIFCILPTSNVWQTIAYSTTDSEIQSPPLCPSL